MSAESPSLPPRQLPEGVAIRPFRPEDVPALEDILRLNGQLDYPEVEGGAAMQRFARYPGNVFLVATQDAAPVGMIRAVYDGARAIIHMLSIHPEQQRRGIGTVLALDAITQLKMLGAPTVSATVASGGREFWPKLGFTPLPAQVFLMQE